MILVVTPNPCIDKTLFVQELCLKEKIQVKEVREISGGKGSNVTRVLRELGVNSRHFMILGGYTGERVRILMEQDGVEVFPAWVSSPTRVVTTVVDERWKQVAFFEPGSELSRTELDAVLHSYESALDSSEVVVMCGSVSCPNVSDVYYEMVKRAKNAGKKTIIDSRGKPLSLALEAAPWLVKMNQEEAGETGGKPVQSGEDVKRFCDFLSQKGVEFLILTFGEKGAMLSGPGFLFFAQPPRVSTINPVGSGDSFLAAFLSVLMKGENLSECLRWGVAAGAANAQMWDAGSTQKEDILSLLPEVVMENDADWFFRSIFS